MQITKEPKYSIEKLSNNQTMVRYTVEINGRPIVSEFSSSNVSDAISGARSRFDRTLRNRYDIPKNENIDNLIGKPRRQDAGSAAFMAATGEELNSELDPELQDFLIDVANVNMGNLTDSEKKNIAERSRELDSVSDGDEPIMIKGVPRNHIPFETSVDEKIIYDGLGGRELREPHPRYFTRPGDKVIENKNNARIILGRDFGPSNDLFYSKDSSKRQTNSGYSKHMGAGAIDIVVGLMSPFPIENVGEDYSSEKKKGQSRDVPAIRDIVVAPSFNTSNPPEVQGTLLFNGRHPGMVMDAARIYISQMTNIDENFKITQNLFKDSSEDPSLGRSDKKAVIPTSAIMLKADKLRLHSRQDIKIVTGGPNETFNSNGNRIRQNNGIHLIAENGQFKDKGKEMSHQQPLVLGDNLLECLEMMCELISDVGKTLDASIESQLRFNMALTNHFQIAAPGIPTIMDPITKLQGISKAIESILERFQVLFQDVNSVSHRINYFNPVTDKYILSRYNTTN